MAYIKDMVRENLLLWFEHVRYLLEDTPLGVVESWDWRF